MDYENAIELENVSKKYDGFELKNVSLGVPKGSIMGFVGQNGAGKSTTIKSILNIVKIDSGNVKIFGLDLKNHEKEIKEDVAVVFDEIPFSGLLNARKLDKVLKGIYRKWDSKTFFDYISKFNLPTDRKIEDFSKGMKMKLQIATALSHNAKLLIMDEATAGLDPVARSEMLDVFMEYMQDGERSIFMSSHITSDIERIADNIAFIHNGSLLLCGQRDEILDSHGFIKCSREDLAKIDEEDIISCRVCDFNVQILVNNVSECRKKYRDMVIDKALLDDIMLYYVKGTDRKEWSI
ncbi:MAG: ABC transporter ATP-binding protein [Lachnospiraceae bacterium]